MVCVHKLYIHLPRATCMHALDSWLILSPPPRYIAQRTRKLVNLVLCALYVVCVCVCVLELANLVLAREQ